MENATAEELQACVESRADDLQRSGLTRAKAKRRAMGVDPILAPRYE